MPCRMNINEAIMSACCAERDAMKSAPDTETRMATLKDELDRTARIEDPAKQEVALSRIEAALLEIERSDRMFHTGLAPLRMFRDRAALLAEDGAEEIDVPDEVVMEILAFADDLDWEMADLPSDVERVGDLISGVEEEDREVLSRCFGVPGPSAGDL